MAIPIHNSNFALKIQVSSSSKTDLFHEISFNFYFVIERHTHVITDRCVLWVLQKLITATSTLAN